MNILHPEALTLLSHLTAELIQLSEHVNLPKDKKGHYMPHEPTGGEDTARGERILASQCNTLIAINSILKILEGRDDLFALLNKLRKGSDKPIEEIEDPTIQDIFSKIELINQQQGHVFRYSQSDWDGDITKFSKIKIVDTLQLQTTLMFEKVLQSFGHQHCFRSQKEHRDYLALQEKAKDGKLSDSEGIRLLGYENRLSDARQELSLPIIKLPSLITSFISPEKLYNIIVGIVVKGGGGWADDKSENAFNANGLTGLVEFKLYDTARDDNARLREDEGQTVIQNTFNNHIKRITTQLNELSKSAKATKEQYKSVTSEVRKLLQQLSQSNNSDTTISQRADALQEQAKNLQSKIIHINTDVEIIEQLIADTINDIPNQKGYFYNPVDEQYEVVELVEQGTYNGIFEIIQTHRNTLAECSKEAHEQAKDLTDVCSQLDEQVKTFENMMAVMASEGEVDPELVTIDSIQSLNGCYTAIKLAADNEKESLQERRDSAESSLSSLGNSTDSVALVTDNESSDTIEKEIEALSLDLEKALKSHQTKLVAAEQRSEYLALARDFILPVLADVKFKMSAHKTLGDHLERMTIQKQEFHVVQGYSSYRAQGLAIDQKHAYDATYQAKAVLDKMTLTRGEKTNRETLILAVENFLSTEVIPTNRGSKNDSLLNVFQKTIQERRALDALTFHPHSKEQVLRLSLLAPKNHLQTELKRVETEIEQLNKTPQDITELSDAIARLQKQQYLITIAQAEEKLQRPDIILNKLKDMTHIYFSKMNNEMDQSSNGLHDHFYQLLRSTTLGDYRTSSEANVLSKAEALLEEVIADDTMKMMKEYLTAKDLAFYQKNYETFENEIGKYKASFHENGVCGEKLTELTQADADAKQRAIEEDAAQVILVESALKFRNNLLLLLKGTLILTGALVLMAVGIILISHGVIGSEALIIFGVKIAAEAVATATAGLLGVVGALLGALVNRLFVKTCFTHSVNAEDEVDLELGNVYQHSGFPLPPGATQGHKVVSDTLGQWIEHAAGYKGSVVHDGLVSIIVDSEESRESTIDFGTPVGTYLNPASASQYSSII